MQLCMRKVDTKAVMTVSTKFAILLIVSLFIKLNFLKVTIYFAGLRPAGFFLLSLAQRKKQRNIHLTQALPYMEGM